MVGSVKVGDTKIFGTIPYRLLKQGISKSEANGVAAKHRRAGDWTRVEKASGKGYQVWIAPPVGVAIPLAYDTDKDID